MPNKRTTKTTKRGRPKGSRNKTYVAAEALRIPPTCPRCGSQQLPPVAGAPAVRRDWSGMLDGVPYSRIDWQNCQCKQCGQAVRVKTYYPTRNDTPPKKKIAID